METMTTFEEPIRAHVRRMMVAWNAHDMHAFAALFSADAEFVNVVGMWWRGRAQIEAAHVATHRTMFKDSQLSGEVAAVKAVRPDVAVAHLRWTMTGALSPAGARIPPRHGVMVFVLAKDGGEAWTIRAAQNTDIVEPPAPPGR
jgi:uncharacterized protein (TIGR02246 family)